MSLSVDTFLVAATALHAGFQATVTLLVYPALLRTPDADWATEHAAHSRAITPMVAVVYGAALVTCALASWRDPGPWVWLAAGATATVFAVTGLGAAPTHGRLAGERTMTLARRLRALDLLRLAGAVVALAAAVLA